MCVERGAVHPLRMMPPPAARRSLRAAPAAYGADHATSKKEIHMADLIAIGYYDETTAAAAAEEVDRLAQDLVIEPDAVAVIVRNQDGQYKVTTSHHPVGVGASY